MMKGTLPFIIPLFFMSDLRPPARLGFSLLQSFRRLKKRAVGIALGAPGRGSGRMSSGPSPTISQPSMPSFAMALAYELPLSEASTVSVLIPSSLKYRIQKGRRGVGMACDFTTAQYFHCDSRRGSAAARAAGGGARDL